MITSEKRWVYLSLLFVFLFVIVMNYPTFPHLQDGKDTYFYMATANMIIKMHTIPWILHPTSFLGVYPFSAPPGGQTIIAENKILSAISFDANIVLIGDMFLFLGGLLVFLISKKVTGNSFLSLLFMFLTVNMPTFFYWNLNAFSNRILMYILILFAILIMYITYMRLKNASHMRKFLVIGILYVLFWLFLSTIHRTAFLMVVIGLVFLLVLGMYILFKKIGWIGWEIVLKWIFVGIIIFSLLFPFYNTLNLSEYNGSYYNNGFLEGSTPTIQLLNFVISVVGGVGVASIILFLVSLYYYFRVKNNLKEYHLFSISMLVAILLLSPGGLYIRCIIGFAIIFFTIGFLKGTKMKDTHNRYGKHHGIRVFLKYTGISFILLLIFINNLSMRQYWENNKKISEIPGTNMSESAYQVAIYFNTDNMGNGSALFDSWYSCRWIQSHSYVKALPPPLGMHAEINYAVYYTKNITARRLTIWEFITNPRLSMGYKYWYYSKDTFKPDIDYMTLMGLNVNSERANKIIDKYDVEYVVNQIQIRDRYFAWGDKVAESNFMSSLSEKKYVFYENSDYLSYVL